MLVGDFETILANPVHCPLKHIASRQPGMGGGIVGIKCYGFSKERLGLSGWLS